MQNLERIQFVSEYFPTLQGLKLVPLSLVILVETWTSQYWAMASRTSTLSGCFLFLLFILAAILLYQRIGVYYRRRFGFVEPRGNQSKILWTAVLWGVLVAGPLWVGLSWIEYWINSPVSLSGLALTVFFASPWLSSKGRRFLPHYGYIALILAALSLIPLFIPPHELYKEKLYRQGLDTALGLALLVSGLLNHRILVGSLPPLKLEESVENPV